MITQPSLVSREASLVKRSSPQRTDATRPVSFLNARSSVSATRYVSRVTAVLFALALSLSLDLGLLFAGSPSLADRVIEHKLANGLTVLMV